MIVAVGQASAAPGKGLQQLARWHPTAAPAVASFGNRPLVIGLTGGIGSGKSTVAELFAARAVPVIDADVVAREVVAPGEAGLEDVVRRFGADVLTPAGTLDRVRLRSIVFADTKARRDLEDLLHPRIVQRMQEALLRCGGRYCLAVIPLLIEKGLRHLVDRVLVVDVPVDVQLGRVQQRDGTSEAEARAVLDTQSSRSQRLQAAHFVIRNDSDLPALERQVEQLHAIFLQMAQTPLPETTNLEKIQR